MIRKSLAESQVNALLGRLFVVSAAVFAIVLATLGVRGLYLTSQRTHAIESVRTNRAEIDQAMETLDKSRSVKAVSGVEGLAAVSAFQRFFVEQAIGSGCTVREVVASAESQPYVTKFEKDTPPNEYLQLGFKSVLVGSPQQVLSALRRLADSPIHFEFDAVTMRRSMVHNGGSVVELAVELRVLAKGGSA